MFRFIFVAIFLILYLILSIPVFFVEWVIGKFNPHARDISSLRIVQWGFKVILKKTGYVAKKEMEKVPLLSTWMRFVYCLFLDRENPKEGLKTILQAIDYVKKGISICIFPEGTRNKGEELTMLPFKEGAFKIATKTGCPIVPISMNNTAEIFENHFPKIKKTHVVLEYGTPIYPNELDKDVKKHIGSYVQNIMDETIHKNAALINN